MTGYGKFAADPSRSKAAEESMKDLAHLVRGMFKDFELDMAAVDTVIPGDDEFGRTVREQLHRSVEQFGQAGEYLTEAFDAVPNMLQKQSGYLERTQQGMVESIDSAGRVIPETRGGKGGKY